MSRVFLEQALERAIVTPAEEIGFADGFIGESGIEGGGLGRRKRKR
jgi:hypothetical protein